MNKMQYIKLLELRGITKLERGQSAQGAIDSSGGEPTLGEMVKTNELVFLYWLAESRKYKKQYEDGEETIARLKRGISSLEKDRDKLRALEIGGVDNWQGYDIAMDRLDDDGHLID